MYANAAPYGAGVFGRRWRTEKADEKAAARAANAPNMVGPHAPVICFSICTTTISPVPPASVRVVAESSHLDRGRGHPAESTPAPAPYH